MQVHARCASPLVVDVHDLDGDEVRNVLHDYRRMDDPMLVDGEAVERLRDVLGPASGLADPDEVPLAALAAQSTHAGIGPLAGCCRRIQLSTSDRPTPRRCRRDHALSSARLRRPIHTS